MAKQFVPAPIAFIPTKALPTDKGAIYKANNFYGFAMLALYLPYLSIPEILSKQ